MELTLRKANSLSKSLLEAARKLPLNRTVQISVYDQTKPEDMASEAAAVLIANLKDAGDLTKAGYELRDAIGATNATCGISRLLTEKATLDAREKLIASVVEPANDQVFNNALAAPIAAAKLDSVRERLKGSEAQYGLPEVLEIKVATVDIVAPFKDDLLAIRRRKAQIADELLAMNTTAKVSVSAFAEDLLTRFKLV